MVELYIYFCIPLHGMMLNELSIGTTLFMYLCEVQLLFFMLCDLFYDNLEDFFPLQYMYIDEECCLLGYGAM
jgi:hypothetical protein